MMTTLALVGLFATTPAVAGPLEIVDSPQGEVAMLTLNPEAPARVWDGAAWSQGPSGVLWQEGEENFYCALVGRMDPVAGLTSTLRCRDLSVRGGTWHTVAPPANLSFGIYDSKLSFAVTPDGVATIDGLFTWFDAATGEVELQWWNWDSQNRNWVFVMAGIPAIEDVTLDSRGESACVVWTARYSGLITTACDWSRNRLLEQPFTVSQVPAPDAEWVNGMMVTADGWAVLTWYNSESAAVPWESGTIFADGSTDQGPPAQTLVLGSSHWIAYNNANGLVLWNPWGLNEFVYSWPANGWATVGEHAGSVWAAPQDPRGRRGPLTLVY